MPAQPKCACPLCAQERLVNVLREQMREMEIANTIDALEVTMDIWANRQHRRDKWAELLREFAEAWPKE